MISYRSRKDAARRSVLAKYSIVGFISSGTYGKVYKALPVDLARVDRPDELPVPGVVAIKKFKPDKEGDVVTYTGLSQSAIREISLNRELSRGVVLHRGNGGVGTRARGKDALEMMEKQLEAYPSDSESEDDRPLASTVHQETHHSSDDDDDETTSRSDATASGPCENFARLVEVILEEKSVYMVFEYAEHDLLVRPFPPPPSPPS